MAGLKVIRRRIKSVENTRKITRAMKLVSAAKLRKAQDAAISSRQYTAALMDLLRQVQAELGEKVGEHPLLQARSDPKRLLLIVIGGSKGLCGAFNSNVNRRVLSFLAQQVDQRPDLDLDTILLGRKPVDFFRREKLPFSRSYPELPQDPLLWPLDKIQADFEHRFLQGEVDEVFVAYTQFRSAVSMTAVCEKLLPLEKELLETMAAEAGPSTGVALFEPSAEAVLGALLPRVVYARLQQACLSSVAGEHGSRMSAMDAATNNANDLLDSLRLKGNKLRQSGITSEILDIIGGSAAAQ